MNFVKFDVRKFSSGEYDVKISERIYGNEAVIHLNWFKEEERDIFLLLLKIDAVKTNYPNLDILVYAPYLPYMRQDRIFEAGQGVPATCLIKTLKEKGVLIRTMACHSIQSSNGFHNEIEFAEEEIIKVFPDANAIKHYKVYGFELCHSLIIFNKTRTKEGVKLVLNEESRVENLNIQKPFVIYDDIVAGGRTFIECSNALRDLYGNNIKIELTIYHAFLDFGIDKLKESGISKINIINKDSYDYILSLYPNDVNYFNHFN